MTDRAGVGAGAVTVTAPTLSSHIAHLLLSQSPRHAWWAHPALNPGYVEAESETFDIGTAAHALILEGETAFALIDAPDYRTKEARAKRDDARAAGQTPLLLHRWAAVQTMAEAVRRQLAESEEPTLLSPEGGIVEHSVFWEEQGVACRATPDWRSLDSRVLVDLKTTPNAHPAGFSRRLWDLGYDIQAAFYRRAVKAVYGVEAEWRWVVVETEPPHALSIVALDPEALAFADAKVQTALDLWRECLRTNTWSAYPPRVAYAEVPPWVQAQWAERSYYTTTKVWEPT